MKRGVRDSKEKRLSLFTVSGQFENIFHVNNCSHTII